MLARLLFPLCLCCVVLCALVGYLSKRAVEEAEKISTEFVELDVGSLIEKRLSKSTGLVLSNFVFVDRVASIDIDGDGKWDEVALPLFANKAFKSKARYRSVIACFRDVPDLETLKQRLASNELKANYRVPQQEFDSTLHSILAKNFKNMDFKNSPVVTVGYGAGNPVLGEKTLKLSYRFGAVALAVGVLSLIFTVLASLIKTPERSPSRKKPARKKRAKTRTGPPNYDVEPTGGVLDRVRSVRDEQSS